MLLVTMKNICRGKDGCIDVSKKASIKIKIGELIKGSKKIITIIPPKPYIGNHGPSNTPWLASTPCFNKSYIPNSLDCSSVFLSLNDASNVVILPSTIVAAVTDAAGKVVVAKTDCVQGKEIKF